MSNDVEGPNDGDLETVAEESEDGEMERGTLTILDKPTRTLDLSNILTTYTPTPKEQDLINLLLDPWRRNASITKVCELAGISRQTYYTMTRKPEFQAYYKSAMLEVVKQYGGQLVNIGIREAKKGSFPHWKVLMEMGGLYNEKKTIEHDGEMTMSVRFVDPEEDDLDEDHRGRRNYRIRPRRLMEDLA